MDERGGGLVRLRKDRICGINREIVMKGDVSREN